MEFHVWDYSPKIEVRLSDEMIARIRGMTTEKRILVTPVHVQLSPGWKKPMVRRRYYQKIQAKLISHTSHHPFHHIGYHLFSKFDNHGDGRNRVPHKPYVNIRELETVQRVTGVPGEELERSVVSVRNHGSSLEVNLSRFPITADEDWAWLFGCYFSCGGLVTRDRIGKIRHRYDVEERLVRFILETQVFEEKVSPILERMGYKADLKSRGYMKHSGHKLDANRRRGVGNQPRKLIYLPRVLREVMEHFGLSTDTPEQRRHGRRNSSRHYRLVIPEWVRCFPREFIEGFINGGQTASIFKPGEKGFLHSVELRAGFKDPAATNALLSFFKDELGKLGITGTLHHLVHRQGESIYWVGLGIHGRESLLRLFKSFDIQQPVLRARLMMVHHYTNPLLYEVCKRLGSMEILVLGALIEKPRTEQELRDMFRLNNYQVAGALERLQGMHFATEEQGYWRLAWAGAKEAVLADLRKEVDDHRKFLVALNGSFFSRCSQCRKVIPRNWTGQCDCGGTFEPIRRTTVLKPYARTKAPKIPRILEEQVPVGGA